MYKKILVPVDGSETSLLGLQHAILLAKDQKAALRVLHVVHDLLVAGGHGAAVYTSELRKELRERGGKRRGIRRPHDACAGAARARYEDAAARLMQGDRLKPKSLVVTSETRIRYDKYDEGSCRANDDSGRTYPRRSKWRRRPES
jgi:nucleotide-binding universal stress UspA family protein